MHCTIMNLQESYAKHGLHLVQSSGFSESLPLHALHSAALKSKTEEVCTLQNRHTVVHSIHYTLLRES